MVGVETPTLNSETPAVAVKSNARPPATSIPSKSGGIPIAFPNFPGRDADRLGPLTIAAAPTAPAQKARRVRTIVHPQRGYPQNSLHACHVGAFDLDQTGTSWPTQLHAIINSPYPSALAGTFDAELE